MSPRIAFHKVTPDGLAVEIVEFEGVMVLLLAKNIPGAKTRPVQILGVAGREVNTPSLTWYYEYTDLPRTVSHTRLTSWLGNMGYTVGSFDQYGNFTRPAA